jgi:hypothetical protein
VRLSQELGHHGPDAVRRLFWRLSLTWGGIACLIAAGLFLCLPIFRWIYRPENIPSTVLVILLGLLMAKQGFTVSLGAIYLIMDRVATNALVKLPLMLVWLPLGALFVQRWGAEGAAAYQLGAYLTGDLVYFGILLTPWFWRGGRVSDESPSPARPGRTPAPVSPRRAARPTPHHPDGRGGVWCGADSSPQHKSG